MRQDKYLETIAGDGKLAIEGKERDVSYSIDVYQEVLTVGRNNEQVVGQKSFEVSLSGIDDLFIVSEGTLTLEDGRTMQILITSSGVTALHGPK